jgi:hypothetical protein
MPTASDAVMPRDDLTGSYQEFREEDQRHIARLVLPEYAVPERSGRLGRIPAEQATKRENTIRRPNTPRARANWTPEQITYDLKEYSFEVPCDRTDKMTWRQWFDAEDEAAKIAGSTVDLDLEYTTASLLFNRTTWPDDGVLGLDVTHEWDDAANATPLANIAFAKQKLRSRGIKSGLALIITQDTIDDLGFCAEILNRIKYVAGEVKSIEISPEFLRQLVKVDQVIVADSQQNTGGSGAALSMENVWSPEYCMLAAVGTGPIQAGGPQLGRTFVQSDIGGMMVKTYAEEQSNSEIVYAEDHADPNVFHVEAGFLLGNLVT